MKELACFAAAFFGSRLCYAERSFVRALGVATVAAAVYGLHGPGPAAGWVAGTVLGRVIGHYVEARRASSSRDAEVRGRHGGQGPPVRTPDASATDEDATLAWEQRRRAAQAAHLDAKARGVRCAEGCYLCESECHCEVWS